MTSVLLDAMWWVDGPPSGRGIAKSLVRAWSARFPDDRLGLLVPRRHVDTVQRDLDSWGVRATVHPARVNQHLAGLLLSARVRRGYDLVVTHNFGVRNRSGQSVVFIQDVIFVRHREWFSKAELAYFSLMRRLAKRCDRVAGSSVAESTQIALAIGKPVVACGLAIPQDLEVAEPEQVAGLAPGSFLLMVGRINARKNLAAAIEAVSDPSRFPPVAIVGSPNGVVGALAPGEGDASRVIWLGSVSDSQLKWLYNSCATFIMPSLDEGFGLPVIEAMRYGARIALSSIPAFREFGEVGDFFDPSDTTSIAEAVSASLDRDRPVEAIYATWDHVVERLKFGEPVGAP